LRICSRRANFKDFLSIKSTGRPSLSLIKYSISTKSKAKSWIGIGTGNHKIEIIPILDPGQSIGIDAYQVARAV